ncbi:hypothetical protein B296_00029227 [Ensete ventricosum]|uniref:Uncharacterized protein n=1 Tax=Ensete ventricosum TaxID=4639 RepID=A0A426XHE0_ENSVE|nr:hypothetical protein B296_00029227 [Ensete ventricosum]
MMDLIPLYHLGTIKHNEERGQPAMPRPPAGAASQGMATCKGIAHRGGNRRRAWPLVTQRPQEQPAARAGVAGHGLATYKGTARRGDNRRRARSLATRRP